MRAILIIFVLAVLAGVPVASVTLVAQAQSGGGTMCRGVPLTAGALLLAPAAVMRSAARLANPMAAYSVAAVIR